MLVMSSPSGAGKTTISRKILESEPDLNLSISVTTREQRQGEIDGTHYFFVGQERFDAMVEAGDLLEHAHIYGHSYGTPRQAVENALADGRDVLFDIDWQGAQQLREKASDDIVSIYILPPSTDELERRLRDRKRESEEVIRYRLGEVATDVTHWAEYDYVIINNDFDAAVASVRSVLHAERLKRRRQPGLVDFIEQFRAVG
jgi:guanylate kinase